MLLELISLAFSRLNNKPIFCTGLRPEAFPNNNPQIYLGDKAVGRSWRRVLHWFEIPSILRRVFRASLEKIGKGGERAQVFQSKVEHAAKNHATD